MHECTDRKFSTPKYLRVFTKISISLLCISSPLLLTSASWAQLPYQPDAEQNISLSATESDLYTLALPALIQVLQGKEPQVNLDTTSAIPILIRALQGKDPQVRQDAISAIPGIIRALQGKDPQASCISTDPASAIPGLIQALQDKDSVVRFFAASALGCMGEQAKAAIPALVNTLKDPDKSVRLVAVYALDKIGFSLQQAAKNLSTEELNQLVSNFDSAFKIVTDPLLKFPQDAIGSLMKPQQVLQQEAQNR